MINVIRPLWIIVKLCLSGVLLIPGIVAVRELLNGGPISLGGVAVLFASLLLALAPWFLPKWLSPVLAKENHIERQPLNVFFKEAVFRTVEGWIWLATTAAYVLGAMLFVVSPDVIDRGGLQSGNVAVFLVWPILSFIVFVATCSPNYTSSVFSTGFVTVFSLIGFWMVLK